MSGALDRPANPRAVWATVALAVVVAMYVRLKAISIQGGEVEYLAWAMKHFFGGITPGYLKLAEQVAALDYTSLAYPPGYPALLAAFRLAGITDLQAMRVAQAAIDCAGVPLAYFVVRRAGLATALALCAAALYAVYPLWAFGATFLLAEFMSPVLMLGALALVLYCGDRDRPRLGPVAATGAYLGLAALFRPDLLLLPALVALWLLWRNANRRGLAAAAVLLAAFAVPISAWGLHNRVKHGHWVFSTTGGGNALWEGLGAVPNDYGFVLNDAKAIEVLRKKGLTWLSVEADRYFKSEYLRALREHPEFVLGVISWRWRNMLTESENWLPEAESTYRLKRLFDLGGVLLLAIAVLLSRRSPARVLLVAVPVIYALGSIGMTHWEPRYVRYIHLSYLFALLVILDDIAALAARRSPRARLVALAVPCAATVLATGDVLANATFESDSARALTAMEASARRGALAGGYDLCSLAFVPSAPEVRIASRDCTLEVLSSRDPYAYQAEVTVRVAAGSAVLARYAGHIARGGVSLGILTGDGRRFITQAVHGKAGDFEGQMSGYAGRQEKVTFIVSNFNPVGPQTQVVLRSLEIKCHPEPCGPGTGPK